MVPLAVYLDPDVFLTMQVVKMTFQAKSGGKNGQTHVTRPSPNCKAGPGFGEQTPPLRRWTRGSNSGDRPELPGSHGWFIAGRPSYRELSVSRTDGIRQNSHRRSDGSGAAKQSPRRSQDRLRRVSTQP